MGIRKTNNFKYPTKIEIIGKTKDFIYFKYHRAAYNVDNGCFFMRTSNPNAYWLDDYAEIIEDYTVDSLYKLYSKKRGLQNENILYPSTIFPEYAHEMSGH